MDALDEKLKTIQTWMDNLQQQIKTSTAFNTTDVLLNQIISLIQLQKTPTSSEQAVAATYADLDKQVKAQTAALNQATNTLKSQIDKREAEALKLRQAYNDLEVHLREHIAYQTKLNQNLQAQIEEQKRTLTLEEEERALTKALRDTLTTMSSTLDLDKILDHILDTVSRITPYDGANILLIESDLVRVARQKGYQERGLQEDWVKQRIPLTKLAILQQLMDAEKPLAVSDTTNSPMWLGFPDMDWVSSNVIAPIRANGRTLGFLSLDSATPGYFTQADADRLQGFAEQAAIAIQNARLLDRAKRAAVLAERNRLANELHDTISQTLWSISLISERVPAIWQKDQIAGQDSLNTLHQLAQNALTEMRSLLLELHPSSLTDANLGDLIQQSAQIIANRTGIDVTVQIGTQDAIPPEVHFALYRVVQEALNNVALHASATYVEIDYNSSDGQIDLSIQDNGIGFNPAVIDPGHLGLSIMHDRVQNIAGTLEIISTKQDGTLIKVVWIASPD